MQDRPSSYRLSAMRATPYPNRLLEMSATLPETQVRVLNLVVRLTLGWQASFTGERKAHVLITLSQLKKRVGRSVVLPVAEAVAALARSGVIEIFDAGGAPIDLVSLARNPRQLFFIGIARAWAEEA